MPRIDSRKLAIVLVVLVTSATLCAGRRAHGEPKKGDARPEVGGATGLRA